MHPQGYPDPWFLLNSAAKCSRQYTAVSRWNPSYTEINHQEVVMVEYEPLREPVVQGVHSMPGVQDHQDHLKLKEMPVLTRGFTEVNMNLVGPLPPSQGFRYLLTMFDQNIPMVQGHRTLTPPSSSSGRGSPGTEYRSPLSRTVVLNSPVTCGHVCLPSYTSHTVP